MNEEYNEREFHRFVAQNFVGRIRDFVAIFVESFIRFVALFSAQKFVEAILAPPRSYSSRRVFDVTRNCYC